MAWYRWKVPALFERLRKSERRAVDSPVLLTMSHASHGLHREAISYCCRGCNEGQAAQGLLRGSVVGVWEVQETRGALWTEVLRQLRGRPA